MPSDSTRSRNATTSASVISSVTEVSSLQRAPPRAQDEQRQLDTVGTQRRTEAVHYLALAGQHQAGAAGGDAYPADLAGYRGAFEPQLDDLAIDLVDAIPQAGDALGRVGRVGRGLAGLVALHGGIHGGLRSVVREAALARSGMRNRPGLWEPGAVRRFVHSDAAYESR